jgi:hypothetical protein
MLERKNLYNSQQETQMQDVLIIFDNIDRLPKEIKRIFEKRLIDVIRHNPKIRFLTSSTEKFRFEHFTKEGKIAGDP